MVLEERLREILERQEAILDEVERMSEGQDLIVSAMLKLNRELGAQRDRYPLD